MKKIILLVTIALAAAAACKTKKETAAVPPAPPLDCTVVPVTFQAVSDILKENCSRCHSYGSTPGGYDLTKKEDIKRAGSNGALVGSIKHDRQYFSMPAKAAKLPQATIDKIDCWVKNGMKD